jgi:hypothetical protein
MRTDRQTEGQTWEGKSFSQFRTVSMFFRIPSVIPDVQLFFLSFRNTKTNYMEQDLSSEAKVVQLVKKFPKFHGS